MEDYHADGRVTGSGKRGGFTLARALGTGALLACLVLRFGGVEIARADPPPVATDRFIRLNGEPIGTAVPAEFAGCQAGRKANPAGVTAGLQQLVQRVAQSARRAENLSVALNGSGYNYGASLQRSARGR